MREKTVILLTCLALIASSGGGCAKSTAPPQSTTGGREQTIRLMSYNVQRFEGGVGPIKSLVRSESPDILCLQEAHLKDSLFESSKILESVSRDTGLVHIASRHSADVAADQACDVAILSKWPIDAIRVHSLEKGGWVYAIEANVMLESGALRVFSIHTHATWKVYDPKHVQESSKTRMNQVEKLAALLKNDAQLSLVLGDLNATPSSKEFKVLSDVLTDLGDGFDRPLLTTPAEFPLLRFDYAFGSPTVKVISYDVRDVTLSDHRPIVVETIIPFGPSNSEAVSSNHGNATIYAFHPGLLSALFRLR